MFKVEDMISVGLVVPTDGKDWENVNEEIMLAPFCQLRSRDRNMG